MVCLTFLASVAGWKKLQETPVSASTALPGEGCRDTSMGRGQGNVQTLTADLGWREGQD